MCVAAQDTNTDANSNSQPYRVLTHGRAESREGEHRLRRLFAAIRGCCPFPCYRYHVRSAEIIGIPPPCLRSRCWRRPDISHSGKTVLRRGARTGEQALAFSYWPAVGRGGADGYSTYTSSGSRDIGAVVEYVDDIRGSLSDKNGRKEEFVCQGR